MSTERVGVTPSGSTELYRSIAAADAESQTELHKAARSGSAHAIEFAELLLDDGADINERTAQLRTPLQVAIIFRNFEMASMLLGRGADADTQDVHGRSPLLDAVVTADVALVTTLLDRMRGNPEQPRWRQRPSGPARWRRPTTTPRSRRYSCRHR